MFSNTKGVGFCKANTFETIHTPLLQLDSRVGEGWCQAKPNEVESGNIMEALYGPGCFGTGPLAASACSEAPPYPPGTTFSLFTLFHASDFPIFTPFHSLSSPGLPLHSLALQRPNCLAGVSRVAGVEKEGNPSCALIGRFWRHLRSHWSAPSAASAWGEGTDCKCGRE